MYFTDDRLRVLISGAASRIGLACAQAFAARGAELVLSDLDGTALTRVAERLGADSCLCDSMSETRVATFGSDICARYSSLDVLVNAAGSGYVRSLSMLRVTNVLLPLLCAGRGRRFVVNVASIGGFTMANDIFSYASSLVAFERLSEAMAEQVRGSGIEVVGFTPRMARAKPASRAPTDQLYRAQRVDVHHSAQLLVERVAGGRTDRIRATADH
jgi:NADP-dependent 3-hydroxy acid dehydrogenase YdfG